MLTDFPKGYHFTIKPAFVLWLWGTKKLSGISKGVDHPCDGQAMWGFQGSGPSQGISGSGGPASLIKDPYSLFQRLGRPFRASVRPARGGRRRRPVPEGPGGAMRQSFQRKQHQRRGRRARADAGRACASGASAECNKLGFNNPRRLWQRAGGGSASMNLLFLVKPVVSILSAAVFGYCQFNV
jgi:hypothetical protein